MSRENIILLVCILVAVGGLGLFGWSLYSKGPTLPVLRTLDHFELDTIQGTKFKSAELARKVWLVDFIFTRCGGTCPEMSSAMADMQTQLQDLSNVRFVSISVDPKYDTLEALSTYAERYKADPSRWFFLRGELDRIKEIAVKGFALGDVDNPLNHSSKFALVDGEGRIRGYYDGAGDNRDADIRRLARDARSLAKQY